ncbi:MAG: glyoxalase [Rhodospirillales bacterium]|nr:glyoxalase [Rhodospirillales bacterium]
MKLDHINIRTNELETVKDSLVDLLHLEVGARPAFKFPGYWLYSEGHPVVHLTVRDNDPGITTGALDHVAFKDDNCEGLTGRLDQRDIAYDLRIVPGSGVRQVFFKITHDVMIEVDFDPAG